MMKYIPFAVLLLFLAGAAWTNWPRGPTDIGLTKVELACGPLEWRDGLSNRDSVVGGMLFNFTKESDRGMWMRNMRFPLDMFWFDEGGRVTAVERGLQPCSDTDCPIYMHPGKYVLETNPGAVNLRVGQQVDLKSFPQCNFT